MRAANEPIDTIKLGCDKRQRMVFDLFSKEKMSPREIARMTGIHELTVRNLVTDVWLRDKVDWAEYKSSIGKR